ncbi:uncharacterized protein LOC142230471 [Haematobia irritans]|uniref:uncharacterized protein LOC142230471 n=1 Tax=Haematobia irritans TaxID=7368 RepID=UPI003F4FEDA2
MMDKAKLYLKTILKSKNKHSSVLTGGNIAARQDDNSRWPIESQPHKAFTQLDFKGNILGITHLLESASNEKSTRTTKSAFCFRIIATPFFQQIVKNTVHALPST